MSKKTDYKESMDFVMADVVSRPNAIEGKYRLGNFGLEFWQEGYIPESPERVKIRADLADKLIAQAEAEGLDTSDTDVLKSLGEEVNSSMGKSIARSESILTAIMVSLQIIVYYSVALAIWGLAFNKSFLAFGLYGAIAGIIISIFSAPAIAKQRTKERIKDIVFGASILVGNLAIIIGLLGLVVWLIRIVFFN